MNTPEPAILNLALRLIALEEALHTSGDTVNTAVQVCDKLRQPLAKLTGVVGFRSLMSRALVLATKETPALDAVQVREDGSLDGVAIHGNQQQAALDQAAGLSVATQLLTLLVAFIGEPLTLRLVCDVWPDALESRTDVESRDGI